MLKSTVLALALCLPFTVAAHAGEPFKTAGVFCDTREQAIEFLGAWDGTNSAETVKAINDKNGGNAYIPGEGLMAVVKEGLIPFMFSGAIWHLGHDEINDLVGALQDDFGPSELRDITVSDTEISFSKQYEKYKILGNDRFVRYAFKKGEQNTWVGTYSFPTDPKMEGGAARCILTELDFSLIQKDITKVLDNAAGQFALDLGEGERLESRL